MAEPVFDRDLTPAAFLDAPFLVPVVLVLPVLVPLLAPLLVLFPVFPLLPVFPPARPFCALAMAVMAPSVASMVAVLLETVFCALAMAVLNASTLAWA